MNLQHLKYMVEVENVGSITKAAANLFMGQPNLSKAIKEVESEVGIQIFKRSAKGVFPTEKGAEFLEYARTILVQMDKIEALYKPEAMNTLTFSVSVPRATYIAHAFTSFMNELESDKKVTVDFRETNSVEAVTNVCDGTSSLAVIRYNTDYEEYFLSLLSEKSLKYEQLLTFEYLILMSSADELADMNEISPDMLESHTEIVHGDSTVPYLSTSYTKKADGLSTRKRIYVYERGSQFDLLTETTRTFMFVSPIPHITLQRFGLVQKRCVGNEKKYRDLLIYPSSYRFSEQDSAFISNLYRIRDEIKSMHDL